MNKLNLLNKISELKDKVQKFKAIKEANPKTKEEDSLSKVLHNRRDLDLFRQDYKTAVNLAKNI